MPPASEKTRMRFSSSMKAWVSPRLADAGAVLDAEAIRAVRIGLADDPPRAARHFGDHVGPEALHDLIERALHSGKGGEMLDQPIAALHGFARLDGVAVSSTTGRDCRSPFSSE